jgi:hypothetical protein
MKAIAVSALLFSACVDSEPPEVMQDTQAMRNQGGETITVHGCPPGEIEYYDGGGLCYNPVLNLPPSSDESTHYGPEPGGGGGGGGGGLPVVYGSGTRDVFVVYQTWYGDACQLVCAITSAAVCAAVGATCPAASVVTIGGVAVPCTAALIAACSSIAGMQAICAKRCPD